MTKARFQQANLARFAIGATVAGMLAACSGLLGLTDPTLDNSIGGDGGFVSDSANGGDGASSDGSSEAAACSGVDTTSDPKNCGTCGHDCLGGKCQASTCLPVLLAEDLSNLAPLFFLPDTTSDTLFISNIRPPDHIANVVSISRNAVNADGGASTYKLLADLNAGTGNPRGEYPYEMALAGTTLFFGVNANALDPESHFYGGVVSCSKTAGCDVSDPASFAIPQIDTVAVATDGTNLVYNSIDGTTDDKFVLAIESTLTTQRTIDNGVGAAHAAAFALIESGNVYIAAANGIFAYPESGSAVTALSPLEGGHLALHGNYVYFTSNPTNGPPTVNAVSKLGVDAGAPIVIASDSAFIKGPQGIAVDDDNIYVADEGDITQPGSGQVIRCPLAGCGAAHANAKVLATKGNPRAIFDDIDAIYWGNRIGQVWKLAK